MKTHEAIFSAKTDIRHIIALIDKNRQTINIALISNQNKNISELELDREFIFNQTLWRSGAKASLV